MLWHRQGQTDTIAGRHQITLIVHIDCSQAALDSICLSLIVNKTSTILFHQLFLESGKTLLDILQRRIDGLIFHIHRIDTIRLFRDS